MADRWEYQFVRVQPSDEGAKILSDLGAEGWRVVHAAVPTDRPLVIVMLERQLSSTP